MSTRTICGFLLTGLLLAAKPAPAHARSRFTFKVRKSMSLKHVWKKPTFASERYGELMDRGRLFYLGKGLWREQHKYYFLRTKSLKKIVVKAPLDRFLRTHPRLFPNAGPHGKLPAYTVQRLFFYDSVHQVAGIHLADRWMYKAGGRQLYLHWDLKRNRITHAVLLDRKAAPIHWVQIKPIGYDPKAKRLYLCIVRKFRGAAGGRKPHDVSVVAVGPGKLKVLYSWRNAGRFSVGPFYDAKHRRALLVEYAERGAKPAPRAHLITLSGKARRLSFPIPVVTYGVAFSADGKHIYAHSAQNGQVWTIDAKTGTRLRAKHLGSLGHAAGMVYPGTLLVVRNKGFHLLDTKHKLRQLNFAPLKRFHKGFQHTQGTLVAPGRIYLRTSDQLRVIDVRKR